MRRAPPPLRLIMANAEAASRGVLRAALPNPSPKPDSVPAALEPWVEALAACLAADYVRRQQKPKPYRVRLLPPELRGRP